MLARILNRANKTSYVSVYNQDLDSESLRILLSSAEFMSNLKSLDLSNHVLDDEVIEPLSNLVKSCDKLTAVNLSNTHFKKHLFNIFGDLLSIESLDLSSNSLGLTGSQDIAAFLMRTNALESLELSYNNFDSLAAEWIAHGILGNDTLKQLNLCNNMICDQGGYSLLNALQKKDLIERLDLSNNNISDDIIDTIIGFITSCTKLRDLNLCQNYFTDASLLKISAALYIAKSIVEFNIDTSNCSIQNILEFEKALANSDNLIQTQHHFISQEYHSKFKAKKRYLEQLAKMVLVDVDLHSYDEHTLLELNRYQYAIELLLDSDRDFIAQIESELEMRGISKTKPNIDSIALTHEPEMLKSIEYSISHFPTVSENMHTICANNNIELPAIAPQRAIDQSAKEMLKMLD